MKSKKGRLCYLCKEKEAIKGRRVCQKCKVKQKIKSCARKIIEQYGSLDGFKLCNKCMRYIEEEMFITKDKTYKSCNYCRGMAIYKNTTNLRNPYNTSYVEDLCKKIDSMSLEEMNEVPYPELEEAKVIDLKHELSPVVYIPKYDKMYKPQELVTLIKERRSLKNGA